MMYARVRQRSQAESSSELMIKHATGDKAGVSMDHK